MHIFFVYDTEFCKTEYDEPKNAIVYFSPVQIPEIQRVALCRQLMGVACFFLCSFSCPKVVTLQRGKFVFKKWKNYFLVLGGSVTLATFILRRQLDHLWEVFCFYHKSISSVRKECDNRANFLLKMNEIWSSCLKVSTCFGSTLHCVFDALPLKSLPKECSDVYSKSCLLLQSLQRQHHGLIGGSIFCRNWLLFTQLPPELTSCLRLIEDLEGTGIKRSEVKFELPVGVKLLEAYLPASDLNGIMSHSLKQGKCVHQTYWKLTGFQMGDVNSSDLSSGTQGDIDSDELNMNAPELSCSSPSDNPFAQSSSTSAFCRKSSETSTSVCLDSGVKDETDSAQISRNLRYSLQTSSYSDASQPKLSPVTLHRRDGDKCSCSNLSSRLKCAKLKYTASSGISQANAYKDLLECVSECLESTWKRCSNHRYIFTHCKSDMHLSSSEAGLTSACCKHNLSHQLNGTIHASNFLKRWKSEANINDDLTSGNMHLYGKRPLSDTTASSSKSLLDAIRTHLRNILPSKISLKESATPDNFDAQKSLIHGDFHPETNSTSSTTEEKNIDRYNNNNSLTDRLSSSGNFFAGNSDEHSNHTGSLSDCPSPAYEALESKHDSDDLTSEDENEVKEVLLFVLHYNDSIMAMLCEKFILEKPDVINSIWKSSLSYLGDLVVDMKHFLESTSKKEDTPHHFLCYDKIHQKLTGYPCTLQPENRGHRNVQLMHEDFLKNPRLKSLSVVTPTKMIHGFSNSSCEVFYHHPGDGGFISGIPTSRDSFGKLQQKAITKVQKDIESFP